MSWRGVSWRALNHGWNFFDEISVWGKVGRKIVGEDGVLVRVDGTLVGLSYKWAVLRLEAKKLSLSVEQRGHHNI